MRSHDSPRSYSSMYQKPRTGAQDLAFRRALGSMDLLYAHQLTVKFRLTRSLSDATGLPYDERGWPFFETTVSRLASPAWHVFDLGRVDFTAPITFSTGTTSTPGYLAETGEKRTLTFEGQLKSAAQLVEQASYSDHNNSGLAWALRDQRKAPALPERFAAAVRRCTFTNQADVESVIRLQERVAQAVFESVPSLHFEKLAWGPAEVGELVKVLPQCRHVTYLDLGANFLGDEGAICLLRNGACSALSRLEINLNQLTDATLHELGRCAASGGLRRMRHLVLWGNSFTEAAINAMCQSFADASKAGRGEELTELHLSSTNLNSVPRAIFSLKSLSGLALNRNMLTAIPEEIGSLKSLSVLSLARNKLTAIPEALFRLKHLKRLDLQDNCIGALPALPCELPSLTTLNLSRNRLEALPSSIDQLTGLESLQVSGNRLTALPDSILRMRSLGKVDVQGNGSGIVDWLASPARSQLQPRSEDHASRFLKAVSIRSLIPQSVATSAANQSRLATLCERGIKLLSDTAVDHLEA